MAKAVSTRYYKRICVLEEQALALMKLLAQILSLLVIVKKFLHS